MFLMQPKSTSGPVDTDGRQPPQRHSPSAGCLVAVDDRLHNPHLDGSTLGALLLLGETDQITPTQKERVNRLSSWSAT